MIDSDHLEELLSIERKNVRDNADLQKALLENHIKVLEGKLDNLKQQVEHIKKYSCPISISKYRYRNYRQTC
jgi:hypothetical protein